MRVLTPAFITLIMLIVIGGLIAVYIGKSFFYAEPAPPQEVSTRLVPMAGSDIPAGTLITSDHIVRGRLREDKMTRETILNDEAIIGRYSLTDIKQAQPILTSDLYAPGERPPLELEPGMQAVTVSLGDSTAVVDGLIEPGDYVDVHLTVSDDLSDSRYRGGFTMTVFKGIRVLAMNRLTQPTNISRGANTVTFELTPEQSNIILEAQRHGTITVSYNPDGPGDGGVAVASSDRAYFDEILGLPVPPEPPKPFLTEIYRGPHRSVIGYGDERDDYDDFDGATPWIEEPGWAPPRNSGGYGRGNRGYNRGYRGYRGTQNSAPQGGGQSDPGAARNQQAMSRAGGEVRDPSI